MYNFHIHTSAELRIPFIRLHKRQRARTPEISRRAALQGLAGVVRCGSVAACAVLLLGAALYRVAVPIKWSCGGWLPQAPVSPGLLLAGKDQQVPILGIEGDFRIWQR